MPCNSDGGLLVVEACINHCKGLKQTIAFHRQHGEHPTADTLQSVYDSYSCDRTINSMSESYKNLPPIWVRGWNFATAMAKWVAAGRPMRTHDEIAERLAICHGCERLKNDVCLSCGCQCIETEIVMNKLTLATEKCPLGKWE